jgi:hypothetical protein
VASETRKHKRAQERQAEDAGRSNRPGQLKTSSAKPPPLREPVSAQQWKSTVMRLALPVVGAWILFGSIAAIVGSPTLKIVLIAVPALITLAAIGLLIWVKRQASKMQGVASILSKVDTAEDRKAALTELETSYKKGDTTAIFARAQLELQDDPKKALQTLEQIDLSKVMASVADEARAQRAMIHLLLGEVGPARQLVDNVDLKRHQDPKTRVMLTAVCAEAWARSGSAKKSLDTLKLFDPEDPEFTQLRPQLYRALAFASAHGNDIKGMRRALKKLAAEDARILGGFMNKKTHPLLQKEARLLAEQSGVMQRKMTVQRRI